MKSGTTYLHTFWRRTRLFLCAFPRAVGVRGAGSVAELWRGYGAGYWRDRERYLQLFESPERQNTRTGSVITPLPWRRVTGKNTPI